MFQGTYGKTVRSGGWFAFSIGGQKAIGLVTFFVLARLLTPEHYGTMTIALILLSLLNSLTTVPFGEALIQKTESIEPYLDPYWSFDVVRSVTIALVLFFVGPTLATFFNLGDSSALLIKLSGLIVMIQSFSNVRQVYFFKQLDLSKVFIRDMAAQLAFPIVTISYALFIERSAWALFSGTLAQNAVGTIMSYVLYPSRPRFVFAWGKLRELIGYTKWVFGQYVFDLLLQQFDKLVVGKLLTAADVGIYAKSKDLAGTMTAMLTSLIMKIGLPAFSKVQQDLSKVREGLVRSTHILLMTSVPFALILLLEGGAMVQLFLGDAWVPIVQTLKIFAFGNIFLALIALLKSIFGALGRPDVNFKTTLIQTVLAVPLMIFGILHDGIRGLSFAIVATWLLMVAYLMVRSRMSQIMGFRAQAKMFLSGGIASVGVLVVDLLFRGSIHAINRPVITVAWIIGLGTIYQILLFVIGRIQGGGPHKTLLSLLQQFRRPPTPTNLEVSSTHE